MAKKKENLVTSEVTSSQEVLKKMQLKAFLAKRLPSMFDRDPVITGNLDLLVNEIYEITG